MSILDAVSSEVSKWCQPYEVAPFTVVPTFLLYPSNACVQVFVEGGRDSFVVSDGGGAIDVSLGLGSGKLDATKLLKSAAKEASLNVNSSGWIYAKGANLRSLTSIISVVADCSKSAAEACARSFRPESKSDFRKELEEFLTANFGDRLTKQAVLLGGSNKTHRYDYAIKAGGGRLIVIDAVMPDSSSINSAIVSHIDLRNAKRSDVTQRIIYDDRLEWKSSDLSLLEVGATSIAFTYAEQNIDRLAA